MRIASWNVNSVHTRVDRVLAALDRHSVDVAALQETKATDKNFPFEAFEAAGYEVAHFGLNQWNGVAVVSRVGIEDVQRGFPDQPGFHKDPQQPQDLEARALGATCGGVRVWSLYVPNGRALGDPHYTYKLQWLYALERFVSESLANDPDQLAVYLGDFNIAPKDTDVWDPSFFAGKTHVSEPERAAFEALIDAGLLDISGQLTGEAYTYWDYQAGRFGKDEGMRIDFHLATPALARTASAAEVDREERSGKGASDHAPVVVAYDLDAEAPAA